MATTTRTVQEQAKELLTTCADVIKNGGWICGSVHETLYTDAPRNQKPPGCAVGLLGIWGDLLPIFVEKYEDDQWVVSTIEENPSDWDAKNKNYDVGVAALKALARSAKDIQMDDDGCWDENDDISTTEEYVITYNDLNHDSKRAEEWFRSAIHFVR